MASTTSDGSEKKRTITAFFGDPKRVKVANEQEPIFVICPGAGGVLPKDGSLEAQLSKLGRIVVISKSTGYSGLKGCLQGPQGALNVNLQTLTDAIGQAVSLSSSTSTTSPIVLVGTSFGCRVIVHWLSENHEVRKYPSIPTPWTTTAKPPNYEALRARVTCCLFFGYPLHHATQDRSAALKLLPASNRALFVIGTSDKMALGEELSKSYLEDVLAATPATTEICWVPKGGHSPPKSSKWTTIGLCSKVQSFIQESQNEDDSKA